MSKIRQMLICFLIVCVSFTTGIYVSNTVNKKEREKKSDYRKNLKSMLHPLKRNILILKKRMKNIRV